MMLTHNNDAMLTYNAYKQKRINQASTQIHHVEPAPELVAYIVKMRRLTEAQLAVKLNARLVAARYAGYQHLVSALTALGYQRRMSEVPRPR